MSAEKHQGASLEGMFPKLTPEQEARLRPVTEKDVLLSPEEAAALSEEERVEMETMRWKQVPPEEGSDYCHRLVWHGREVCTARTKPYCDRCCLADICPKTGV